jgi:hypothetical protein
MCSANFNFDPCRPLFVNCILWNGDDEIQNENDSTITLRYCDVRGGWPGEANIDVDPLFASGGQWTDCALPTGVGCRPVEWDFEAFEAVAWARWSPGHYSLRAGSPCIDSGTCEEAPDNDIDGTSRPSGGGCDIGAYEHDATRIPVFVRGDTNADGDQNLSDAVYVLGYLFTAGETPICQKAADTNDTGDINLTDAVYTLNHLFLAGPPPEAPTVFPPCAGVH